MTPDKLAWFIFEYLDDHGVDVMGDLGMDQVVVDDDIDLIGLAEAILKELE